jgi:hypothetical protein
MDGDDLLGLFIVGGFWLVSAALCCFVLGFGRITGWF